MSIKEPIVNVEQGKLRGLIGINYFDEKFYKFYSIPFAKPPKRFQVRI